MASLHLVLSRCFGKIEYPSKSRTTSPVKDLPESLSRSNATIVFFFGTVPDSEDVLLAFSHAQIQSKSVSETDSCFCMLRGST